MPKIDKYRPYFGVKEGDLCPHCKIDTIKLMNSKFGKFYGCKGFPYCAFTEKIIKQDEQTTS